MKNRGKNTKENNLWGCLVMGKIEGILVGPMHFASCAIKKKPLQIGVIYGRIWQRRGVDGKLLNVPFPSLYRCCVLGSLVQFIFPFFFQRVFFHFSNSDLFFLIIGLSIFFLLSKNRIFFFFQRVFVHLSNCVFFI